MNRKTNLLLLLALFALLALLFAVISARVAPPRTLEERAAEIHPPVAETPPAWQRGLAEEAVAYIGPLPYTPAVMPELDLPVLPPPAGDRTPEEAPLTISQREEETPETRFAFPPQQGEETLKESPMEFTVSQDDEGPGGTLVWLGRYNIVGYDTCPQCCGNSNGITASGTVATVGRTVAVKGLPFGTRLYIDGIGERVVEDRGYLADGVIDVLCNDHAECYAITGVYDVWEIVVEDAA